MKQVLILPMAAIETAPKFFSMLALVLRAAGFEVLVLDGDPKRKNGQELAALKFHIPFTHFDHFKRLKQDQYQTAWKHQLIRALSEVSTKVVWVDIDFGAWVDDPKVVTFNWGEAMRRTGAIEVGQS